MICIYTWAMYVCLCHGVTDQEIAQAVADGHRDVQSIQKHLLAGTGCGGCVSFTADLIDELTSDAKTLAQDLSYAA